MSLPRAAVCPASRHRMQTPRLLARRTAALRRHLSVCGSMGIQSINAITLATHDMSQSVAWYLKLPGTKVSYGGADAPFTTIDDGSPANVVHINLFVDEVSANPPLRY